ncbi:MAG: ATP-dependent DNA helicase RecG [Micrococcaceae bacterium]
MIKLLQKRGGSISFLDEKLRNYLGDKSAKAFKNNFGYETVSDLLNHFPRRYVERGELTSISELPIGEDATLVARVVSLNSRRMYSRRGLLTEVLIQGEEDNQFLKLTFFNQYGLERRLPIGALGMFSGKVSSYQGSLTLSHPEFQLIDEDDDAEALSAKPIPLYPAKAKLSTWMIQRAIGILLDTMPATLEDPIPADILERHNLLDLTIAYQNIHQGQTLQDCFAAQNRFRFQEAFLTQTSLVMRKANIEKQKAKSYKAETGGLLADFDAMIPFELTNSQKRVSKEIAADLAKTHPMNRLLQGDVGSGKTIVALRAMLTVIEHGGQTVLLAPTEVLASQHFQSIYAYLGELNFKGVYASLLTGSMSAKEKKRVLLNLASGQCNLVVATHVVLSEHVQFVDLGLVIIDEQHRFGVDQRDVLRHRGKDNYPHTLIMTATPIPRSVAMTIFGDLEISTIDELPAGRAPITTHVVNLVEHPSWAGRILGRAREEVAKGHQVYIVCSKIGDEEQPESSDNQLKRMQVSEFAEILQNNLPQLQLGILHSRLDTQYKDRTMAEFAAGNLDVLVSTTVVEVGVDVHNATMMVVMDADRFGVSQLHQLRGRVGRGGLPGLCLLVTQLEPEHEAIERLNAVASTIDGFKLSLLDLEQRREGDVLSAKQSGASNSLKLLKVTKHKKVLETARQEAERLITSDPELLKHQLLRQTLDKFLDEDTEEYLEKN